MSDKDQIKALDAQVANGINSGDSDVIAAQYTEDAIIMPPGAPLIEGKAAIQEYWQAGIDGGLTDVRITPSQVDVLGERSVTVGTVTGQMGEAKLAGKYIVVAKNTGDGWKIHQDIWNFDA